jgi:hypothetical protein
LLFILTGCIFQIARPWPHTAPTRSQNNSQIHAKVCVTESIDLFVMHAAAIACVFPYYLLLSITIRQHRAGFLLRVCVCRFECVCMLVRSCIKPCKHTTMFVLYHFPFSSLFPNTLLNRPIQLSSIILQHTVPKKGKKKKPAVRSPSLLRVPP